MLECTIDLPDSINEKKIESEKAISLVVIFSNQTTKVFTLYNKNYG